MKQDSPFLKVLEIIGVIKIPKKKMEGKDRSGTIECPKCKVGHVKWIQVAYNGHTRGQCTTEGCLSWIE